jgi:hypothetical protein
MSQPTYSSSTGYIGEQFFTLVFDSALDPAHLPPVNAFEVEINGIGTLVTAVELGSDAHTVKVSFTASALTAGDFIEVTYSDPTAGNDINAIQGLDGTDAATFSGSANVSGGRPARPAPPARDTGVIIDGAVVHTDPVALPGGRPGFTVVVDVSYPRVDTDGKTPLADVPLVTDTATASPLLVAHLPDGLGLRATGGTSQPPALALEQLFAEIGARMSSTLGEDQSQLTSNAQQFLSSLSSSQQVLFNSIAVNGSGSPPTGQPLVLSGTSTTGLQTALLIDTTHLASAGPDMVLEHVSFAAMLGKGTLRGDTNGQILSGDSAAQHFLVGGGVTSAKVQGGGGNDVLELAAAALTRSRALAGAPGNLLLDGGTGADVVRLGGNQADYTVERGDGHLVVTNKASGVASTLLNVETIQFADGTMELSSRDELGKIAALYQNILGRQADVAGFEFWGDAQNHHGVSLGQLAINLMTSGEGRAHNFVLYDNDAYDVALLYEAVFGREADPLGAAYWVAAMQHGLTLVQVADSLLASSEMSSHALAATAWNLHF